MKSQGIKPHHHRCGIRLNYVPYCVLMSLLVFGWLWVCLNQRDETVRSVSATTESAMNVNKKVVILGGCRHGKLSGKADEDRPGYPCHSCEIL